MEGQITRVFKDPVILITGATDGIGRLVAHELAGRGATVLVHGRDASRCATVVDELHSGTGNFRAEPFVADLSSLAAVKDLAAQIEDRFDRLDVLINNAAVGAGKADGEPRSVSQDGYELRLAVNFLAPFLLTHLLLPLLRNAAPSRVVNVASAGQRAIHFHDPMLEERFDGLEAYRHSKLALVMFSLELAERVKSDGITVNCLHPGTLLDTKMVRETFGQPQGDATTGADAIVYLATAADLRNVTGQYFNEQRLGRAHPQAYDASARRRLWSIGEEYTGLTGRGA